MSDKREGPYRESAKGDPQPRAREWRPWREHVNDLADQLIRGVPLEPACRLVGVSFWTVREAIERDDEDAEPLAIALAKYEAEVLEQLHANAKGAASHAGLAWLLERRFPKRWHQSTKLEHTGKDEGPVRHEIKLTLADAIAGAKGGDGD